MAECAAKFGKRVAELSFSEYLSWSRQPAVRRRPGRRARSQIPFDRSGGPRKVKRQVIGGDATDAERAIAAAGADGQGYRYTDEEIFSAADEIIARLGPDTAWPTIPEWSHEYNTILAEERERRLPPRAVPGPRCPSSALPPLAQRPARLRASAQGVTAQRADTADANWPRSR